MSKKKLGIIGGMGSVAGAYLFDRAVQLTPAITDQEYVEIFVHNNSSVPDRTQGILYGGPTPVPELVRSMQLMDAVGADFVMLACMTSHYFIPEIQKAAKAQIIDGIVETARYTVEHHPQVKTVGILASTGNLKMQLFQKQFEAVGVKSIIFNDKDQKFYFMDPIYEPWGIKAGHVTGQPKVRFVHATQRLVELGADAIIGGCSEVPLVLSQQDVEVPFVDAIDVLIATGLGKCMDISPRKILERA